MTPENGAERAPNILWAAGWAAACTGARAAALLETACEVALARAESPRAAEIRSLAGDLRVRLDAMIEPGGGVEPDLLPEAALRCADLANLAASNAEILPPGAAGAIVNLCAGAVRALRAALESGRPEDGLSGYAPVETKSALWRVELAVRQLEESGSA